MFSQFFGNYLLQQKLISTDALRGVLALQDSVRVKLGVLAIDAGYMTAEQVNKVHRLQSWVDKRFGEIAIEEGFLDEDKLSNLLGQQNSRHLLISQALIDKNILTFEEVERALAQYKKDSGFSDAEFEALKKNDIDSVAAAFVKMPELGDDDVYASYFALFVRNLVRFIDTDVFLERAERVREEPFECLIHQEMDGRFKLFTGFAGPEDAMCCFAGRFAGMSLSCMDEVACDSLAEFINIQNGLFLSRLSNNWVELELVPSGFCRESRIRSVGVVYKVPFTLSFGRFNFFIGQGSPTFG
jgi:hypothetical protein